MWGGFAGMIFDFPLSVFTPIYISHVADMNFNIPSFAGLPDEE